MGSANAERMVSGRLAEGDPVETEQSSPSQKAGVGAAVGIGALLVALGVLVAIGSFSGDGLTDEEAHDLAERVGEQARDQHLDSLRRVNDGTDPDSARDRLLRSIEAPEGVEEVQVNGNRQKTRAWDDFRKESVSRPVVVVPEEGGPFCAVVGISSDGDYRGVPADGDVEDRCRDATHFATRGEDPLIGDWAHPQR